MKLGNSKFWAICIFASAFTVFGLLFGEKISIDQQREIAKSLQASAAIIFGFVGVWLGLVYPPSIEKLANGKTDTRELESRVKALIWAVFILVCSLCLSLIATTTTPVISIFFPEDRQPQWTYRSIHFAAINLFAFIQITTLILTVYPLLGIYVDFQTLLQKIKSTSSVFRGRN